MVCSGLATARQCGIGTSSAPNTDESNENRSLSPQNCVVDNFYFVRGDLVTQPSEEQTGGLNFQNDMVTIMAVLPDSHMYYLRL